MTPEQQADQIIKDSNNPRAPQWWWEIRNALYDLCRPLDCGHPQVCWRRKEGRHAAYCSACKNVADARAEERKRCCEVMERVNAMLFEALQYYEAGKMGELIMDAREILGPAIRKPPAASDEETEQPEDNSPEVTRGILGLADRDAPLDVVAGWTEAARKQASDWAGAVILVASDNEGVNAPPEPAHVARYVQVASKATEGGC